MKLTIDLSPAEESDIHGWVNYYRMHPEEAGEPYRIVLKERTRARFEQIEAQFDSPIQPSAGHWQLIPGPLTGPYFGPIDPDQMAVPTDWQAFQQLGIGDRRDIFTRKASDHPNGQRLGDNSITLDVDAYVAAGGTFKPWLVKV